MSLSVREREENKLSEFIGACKKAGTYLVKFTKYGFVEPGNMGGGNVGLIGKKRFVLTAFLKQENVLLRWQGTKEVHAMITFVAGSEGEADGTEPALDESTIKGKLELEDILVSQGEWTKEQIESLLQMSG